MEKEALVKELEQMKNPKAKVKAMVFEDTKYEPIKEEEEDEETTDVEMDGLCNDVTWSKLLDESISDVLKEYDSNIIAKCKIMKYEIQLRRHRTSMEYKELISSKSGVD